MAKGKKNTELGLEHVEEVMSKDIVIGSETKNGSRKRFCFNPWANEYCIYNGQECVARGQAIEELLEVYNGL